MALHSVRSYTNKNGEKLMAFDRFGGRGFGRRDFGGPRCIRQPVLIAVLKQKFRSNQPKEDQFTAENVTLSIENIRLLN